MKLHHALLVAGVLLTGAAHAATPDPDRLTNRVAVSFADLDLDTTAGRATLEDRVERASRTVCGRRPMDRLERTLHRKCVKGAREGAGHSLAMLYSKRGYVTEAFLVQERFARS